MIRSLHGKRVCVRGVLILSASLLLPHAAASGTPPRDVSGRAETLAILKARHPDARFRLEPAVDEPLAAAPEGAALARLAVAADYDQQRLLAGHLLRHATFGPTAGDLKAVAKLGPERWLEQQLSASGIDDSACERRLPKVDKKDIYDDWKRLMRWYARTVCTQRQLNEKMTLIWHELFATSNEKVGIALLMEKQEQMFRRNALSDFRTLLINVTTDQAMLIFLDNDPNSGTLVDEDGNRISPNRNYAREFLQLFTLGPVLLHMDGTPVLDAGGVPLPTYSEDDVNEVARALTGWEVDWRKYRAAYFIPEDHDEGAKTIFGVGLPGRSGASGRLEVNDVVDTVMAHPNLAPFVSKYLIQKLASERPSPAYVQRVSTVFRDTDGDIKRSVRAILLDPEFGADANLRAGYKEPIEHFVGAARGLGATTDGAAFIDWSYLTKQLLYYPPSVFSFYPPGQKRQLVNTATVTYRDRGADELAAAWWSVRWSAEQLIKKNKLTTPERAVDFLTDALLVAPLQSDVRQRIVDYMEGGVDAWKLRGAAWLVMTTPDYQRQ